MIPLQNALTSLLLNVSSGTLKSCAVSRCHSQRFLSLRRLRAREVKDKQKQPKASGDLHCICLAARGTSCSPKSACSVLVGT